MASIANVVGFLEAFAPTVLAETWDNVGLLVGDASWPVSKIMTCLTITPDSSQEAIQGGANLIVTHHPLPFRPLHRVTASTPEGRMLLELIAARIAIYSPHTAFDSARGGINQQLAEGLGLAHIEPLMASVEGGAGAGRFGRLAQPMRLADLVERTKEFLSIPHAQAVGSLDRPLTRIAVACGSAGEFLEPARLAACHVLVTGEVRFHTCLEAEATGIALVLAGHFASERFALEQLARVLAREFPQLEVWASRRERDPLHWM